MPPLHAPNQGSVADHFSERASSYSKSSDSGIWNSWRAMERRAIWKLLRPTAGECILDAGCGAGYYSSHLVDAGASVFATDLSPSMTRETSRRLQIPAFVSNLENLSISSLFDAVLCAGALEFCGDPAAAIAGMTELISPTGRLVLMLPTSAMGGRFYRYYHSRHGINVRLFTVRWLEETAAACGMSIRERRAAGFNHVVRMERLGS